jgi:hypothetical protein
MKWANKKKNYFMKVETQVYLLQFLSPKTNQIKKKLSKKEMKNYKNNHILQERIFEKIIINRCNMTMKMTGI